MLAIKIFPRPPPLLCLLFPLPHIEAEQTGGQLIAAPRLVVSRVNYVGIWRSLVETKSKCKSFIFAAFHVVHWQLNGCPLHTPFAEAPRSTPLLTLLTWRHQDIHFILTIAALCCCRRCRCRGLWQDLIHLVGGTTGDGASSCGQQQQTNQNPNRYQIVGFVAFANHRETLRVWLQL